MMEDPLGLVLVDVARLLRRRFEKALENAGLGLTVAEARTLAFVSRRPGLRQSTLADELSVEPMTLVGFLDRLEAATLVERIQDPADRRAKLIRLTPNAAGVVRRIRTIGKSVREDAERGIDPDVAETMRLALLKMQDNLLSRDDLLA
ncbi:MarR family winged helix-turn-helix transcriptional regulator [Kaistia terrae]|jgi:MarR family transcriptional regulator for hemolysin|uniref:MarR family winged helix-turn-helix transcriptional regulator n=1 Tax=Kaistia terrae TaxID=537017 RepID=A0ABW0PW59_9HYPH|nr:MarR family transcriptional regulator [Kaistia terrae]MCX5581610.1 MarR family transcriptional regulator [Kaistia terrae]